MIFNQLISEADGDSAEHGPRLCVEVGKAPLGVCLDSWRLKDFGCSVVTSGKKSPGSNKLSQHGFETPQEEEASLIK